MRLVSKIMLAIIPIIFGKMVIAQSWNYDKLKAFYSKTKLSPVEGFYELDSDTKCLIGLVKNGEQYQIVYLFGNSKNWVEGDIKGFLQKKENLFSAKWDGSLKPGTVPLFNLNVVYDLKGFFLKWPNDSPDYFRKVNTTESELIRKKYLTERSVKMIESKSGVFEIPALINNVLRIYLILDTGASEVSISPDIVLTLIKAKAINDEDWLEGGYYKFADGSIAKSQRFMIRYLKIGDFEIKNVEASISNSIEAPLLLGQSALSQLGKIQIDYKTKEFRIIN
jgi:hypothetical protein